MEQPKKPGAAPTKDISDLKARLGLRRPEATVPMPGGGMQGGMQQVPSRGPGQVPMPGAIPGAPGRAPAAAHPGLGPRPGVPAPIAQPAPASAPVLNPYASMKPQQGHFDLRSIDDGMPVEKVRAGAGKAVIITSFVVGVAAFALGAGLGISSVGRANMNTANRAARTVKTELEGMQKTLTQIGTAFALSAQRMSAAKRDSLSYDPKLIEDLQAVKLDPRPDTSKIFRVDYYRLEDLVVDHLFNYYYDSIAVYAEVERHIKRTKNDAESLKTFVDKEAAKQAQNYGVVFDTAGKLTVANLVEVGEQVCKGGAPTCPADQMEGFKIRSNTGAPWVVQESQRQGRRRRSDEADPVDGRRHVRITGPGTGRVLQAARRHHPHDHRPTQRRPEGTLRRSREGRHPSGRLRAVLVGGRRSLWSPAPPLAAVGKASLRSPS